MKLPSVTVAIVIGLSACSQEGSSSLEELSAKIEEAILENRPKQITDAIYWEGADPEVRDIVSEMFGSFEFSGLNEVSVESHDFDDFKPTMNLPGQLHGRPLKWLEKPSHWIVVEASGKDESGNKSGLNLELAAGQVNGKWRVLGCTYAGEAPEKASVPGLTDRHATAIAFNEAGEVLDFVTIKSDSDIQEIVFMAPENGELLSVTVIGPSRHEELPEDFVVSSRVAEGMRGKVSVHVQDGVVTGIYGNGISQGSPLDESDLKMVLEQIQSGSHVPSERVEIIRE